MKVTSPGNICDLRVRLVPDVSAAALRSKQTRELALWYCLRSLNFTGSGYLSLEKAIDGLCSSYGYSRRTIFRTLSLGEGLFWNRIPSKRGTSVKIYGLSSVCGTFQTNLFNTLQFYEVSSDRFRSLKSRRLALWESIAKPKGRKANPISRQSLVNYTGVQIRQQQRWDKESQVKRTACFRLGCPQPRLPNIYHSPQPSGHRGMLPRVRRILKSLITDEAIEKRRYFASIGKMLRVKERDDPAYLFIRRSMRKIKGRLEWESVYQC